MLALASVATMPLTARQTEPTAARPEATGTYELHAPVPVATIDTAHAYALVRFPPVVVMAKLQALVALDVDHVPVVSIRPSYSRERSTAGNGPASVLVSWRLPG
jgi:hypothetical protein